MAEVGGRRVAFLPRHGRDHRFPPHRIPYRANLWALRCSGRTPDLAPVRRRRPAAGARAGHVRGARPADRPHQRPRADVLRQRRGARARSPTRTARPGGRRCCAAAAAGSSPVDGGTMVVVEGPRFSTRAESRWYTAIGGAVVNMTGHPEAVLARELALCYTSIALVTDLDAGRGGRPRRHPGGGLPGLRRRTPTGCAASCWTPWPRCPPTRDCSVPARAGRHPDCRSPALRCEAGAFRGAVAGRRLPHPAPDSAGRGRITEPGRARRPDTRRGRWRRSGTPRTTCSAPSA